MHLPQWRDSQPVIEIELTPTSESKDKKKDDTDSTNDNNNNNPNAALNDSFDLANTPPQKQDGDVVPFLDDPYFELETTPK